jgi:hypothetical protein
MGGYIKIHFSELGCEAGDLNEVARGRGNMPGFYGSGNETWNIVKPTNVFTS